MCQGQPQGLRLQVLPPGRILFFLLSQSGAWGMVKLEAESPIPILKMVEGVLSTPIRGSSGSHAPALP